MSKLIIDGINGIIQDNVELRSTFPFDITVTKLTAEEINYFIENSFDPSIMQVSLEHYLDASYQAQSSHKVVLKLGTGCPWNVDIGNLPVYDTATFQKLTTNQNRPITIGGIGYLEAINRGKVSVVNNMPGLYIAATSGDINFYNKQAGFMSAVKIGNDSSLHITGENITNPSIDICHNSTFTLVHDGLEYKLTTPAALLSEDIYKSYNVNFYKLIELARAYYLFADANVSVSLLNPPLQDLYNYMIQNKEIVALFIKQNQEHVCREVLNELIIDGQNKEIIQGDIELVSSGYHMRIQLPTLDELRAAYPSNAAPSMIEEILYYAASNVPSFTLGTGTKICKVSITQPYNPLFHFASHQTAYTNDGGPLKIRGPNYLEVKNQGVLNIIKNELPIDIIKASCGKIFIHNEYTGNTAATIIIGNHSSVTIAGANLPIATIILNNDSSLQIVYNNISYPLVTPEIIHKRPSSIIFNKLLKVVELFYNIFENGSASLELGNEKEEIDYYREHKDIFKLFVEQNQDVLTYNVNQISKWIDDYYPQDSIQNQEINLIGADLYNNEYSEGPHHL